MAGSVIPKLEWAPAVGSNDTPTSTQWVDITSSLRQFAVRRGRATEGDQFQAGGITATLSNRDRTFDPTSTAIPSSHDLIGSPIRLQAVVGASTEPIYRGHVTALNPRWQDKGDQTVELAGADGLALTQRSKLDSPWSMAVVRAGQPRVWHRLNAAAWEDKTEVADVAGHADGPFPGAMLAGAGFQSTNLNPQPTTGLVGASTDLAVEFLSTTARPFAINLAQTVNDEGPLADVRGSSTGAVGKRQTAGLSYWTVSMWARPELSTYTYESTGRGYSMFYVSPAPSSDLGVAQFGAACGWYRQNGDVVWELQDSVTYGNPQVISSGSWAFGETQHIVFTAGPSTMAIYRQGALSASTTISRRVNWGNGPKPYPDSFAGHGSWYQPTESTATSESTKWGMTRFTGAIDEAVIWRTTAPMASTAISDLYDAGKSEVWNDELAGTRINRVLDAVGWSTSTGAAGSTGRYIEPGITTIAKADNSFNNQSAGEHIHEVGVRAEAGRAFVNRAGGYEFHDRHSTLSDDSQLTLSDDGTAGDQPWVNLALRFDDSDLANMVNVQRINDATQTATSTASIDKYGERAIDMTSIQLATNEEALALGEYQLTRRSEPKLGAYAVDLFPDRATAPTDIVSLEIGDRVTVQATPSTGAGLEFDAVVEGINHGGKPGQAWRTSIQISNAAIQDEWLILDSTTQGFLDVNKVGF